MAHEIIGNGIAGQSVDTITTRHTLGWTGLGTAFQGEITTIPEARKQSGLDWEPEEWALSATDGTRRIAIGDMKKAIVRTLHDGTPRVLGVVGNDYSVVSNAELFSIVWDVVKESGGEAHLESAMSLFGGEVVCLCVKGMRYDVGGNANDTEIPYLVASNGHNGRESLKFAGSITRVVCNNTRRAALSEGRASGRFWSMKHTLNLAERKGEIQAALGAWGAARKVAKAQADTLAGVSVTVESVQAFFVEAYTRAIGPIPTEKATEKRDVKKRTRALDAANKFNELFDADRKATGGTGTLWNATNAMTEWLQKYSAQKIHNDENATSRYAIDDLFGDMADAKDKVIQAALSLV